MDDEELKNESALVLWILAAILTPAMILADLAIAGRQILAELQRRRDESKPKIIR